MRGFITVYIRSGSTPLYGKYCKFIIFVDRRCKPLYNRDIQIGGGPITPEREPMAPTPINGTHIPFTT
jgi:hypothetical protein